MKHWILAIALPAVAAAQTTARPITLEEAVKLAQQNSPQTIRARNTINANNAAVRTAWGSFLPTLSVSQGANHSGGKQFFQGQLVDYTGPPWSFSRNVSTSLRLFDAGQRNYQLSAAKANVTAAEADELAQRYTVGLNVAIQYFGALAARESRGAAEAQLQQALEQQKAANARVRAGAAIMSDSLQSIISVGQAQLAILTADNDLQNANAGLTRLVATPFIVTASPGDSLVAESFAVDSAALMGQLESAPTVASAESAVSAARSSLKASRTSYFPTLSLSGSMGGSKTAPNFDLSQGAYSQSKGFGLSLAFTVFNGFTREQNVNNSGIAEDNARATLRDVKLGAQTQLIQYIGALHLADAQMRIQQASVDAALEVVRVQQQRYGLGASTLLELLTAQSQLNSARLALIRARQTARINKANIENLIGRSLP
jgi:outer membrane protein